MENDAANAGLITIVNQDNVNLVLDMNDTSSGAVGSATLNGTTLGTVVYNQGAYLIEYTDNTSEILRPAL